jgi:adenylate cyclase, class 2
MPLEREIKLRVASADDARARVSALGATPLKGRRLQEDCLLDDEAGSLRDRRSVLRVRNEGGKSLLTFKGPTQPGPMKLREERETIVADGHTLVGILEELGLRIWFRYEKYREEFAAHDAVIAIDETPVGTFIEIEGSESAITRAAELLGFTPADYITDSYRTLFLRQRDAGTISGDHMVFASGAGA